MKEELQVAIEAKLIDMLDEKRKEKGMSVEEWAKSVYPGVSSGRMRLQHLRKPQSSGKRKRLLFSEFISMTLALGIHPATMVTLVMQDFDETKI